MIIQTFEFLIALKNSPEIIAGFNNGGHVVQFLKANIKNADNYTIIVHNNFNGSVCYSSPEKILECLTDAYL